MNHLVRAGPLCKHIWCSIVETAVADRDPDLGTALVEIYVLVRLQPLPARFGVFEARDI